MELEQFNTFKDWSKQYATLYFFEVDKAFEFFISRRIKELEQLQEKCETNCEKQANIRVIQELKTLLK